MNNVHLIQMPSSFIPPVITGEMREFIENKEMHSLYKICEAAFMQAFASLERACTTPEAWLERFDALDWIFRSDPKHPFCFDNVCALQGYDPDRLRDEIEEQCMTEEEKDIWL